MSRIAFNGNALGTGTVTIASPNTNSDQTLTLPDSTGTVLLNGGAASFSTLTVNSNNISAVNSMGFRNRIINGDMRIDQRNAGAAVTANDALPVDRFRIAFGNSAGAFSGQQTTTAPAGFVNSLKYTTTTADASLGATEYATLYQVIEGLNVADLAWGTASAATVTLSFWCRSSQTGTFGGALRNSANNRSYPFSYSISVANTWEQKSITIAGDTSGTWLTTNGAGVYINWSMGAGSTLSGTAGAWAAANHISVTGAVNLIATLNADFYITGVQFEVGSVATPFERRAYGQELVLCLRYFWKLYSGGTTAPISSGNAENTTRGYINLTLPQPMRTQPTCDISSLTHLALRGGGTNVTCTAGSFIASVSAAMATIIGGEFDVGSSTSASTGGCVKMCFVNAAGWIAASAEL